MRCALLLLLLAACGANELPVDSDTDRETDRDSDTDQVPEWVNLAWAQVDCDRADAGDWARKRSYLIPYTDGQHRMLTRHHDGVASGPSGIFVVWYAERGAIIGESIQYIAGQSNHVDPVYAYININCTGECEKRYFLATSGRVVVTEAEVHGDRMHGFLDQVILQEGSYDPTTGESEVWPDGETWCIEHLSLDSELTTQPMRDR